jgi:hypothetical protein
MAVRRKQVADWSEEPDLVVIDRLAEKLVGAKIDEITMIECGSSKLVAIRLDNGVSVYSEEIYLGEN